jgi:hypothetical protein
MGPINGFKELVLVRGGPMWAHGGLCNLSFLLDVEQILVETGPINGFEELVLVRGEPMWAHVDTCGHIVHVGRPLLWTGSRSTSEKIMSAALKSGLWVRGAHVMPCGPMWHLLFVFCSGGMCDQSHHLVCEGWCPPCGPCDSCHLLLRVISLRTAMLLLYAGIHT